MKQAITRLVVLVVLLINQTLVTIGFDALPFTEDQVYEGVSSVATVIVALLSWWKNNSVTNEAQKADAHMKALKNKRSA